MADLHLHGQNRISVWKIYFLPVKIDLNDGKQIQTSKQHLSLPLFFSRLNFTPLFPTSLPPPPEWLREMGNMGCGQSVTVPLCHSFLLSLLCSIDCSPSGGFPLRAAVDSCSSVVSPGAAGSLLQCLGHIFLPLLLSFGCLQGCFSHFYFLIPRCRVAFCPFSNTLSQRCHRLG